MRIAALKTTFPQVPWKLNLFRLLVYVVIDEADDAVEVLLHTFYIIDVAFCASHTTFDFIVPFL